MDNFIFCSDTEFVFGKGTESRCGELCLKYSATNVLIVYGGGSAIRSGLIGKVCASLDCCSVRHDLLGGVKPNPEDIKVYEGIDMTRKNRYDLILAVGGGSTIDTAKAIAAGSLYEGDFWDFYKGKAKVENALKVGVVLTIPAAGSEGSGNSVITNTRTLQKLSLRSPEHLRPRFSVMNPELTFTLPWNQTAAGICDMMVHIFERYFSHSMGNSLTARISEGILRSIMEEAKKLKDNPLDYDARANIMWASTLAHNGLCGTGRIEDWGTHFMEHELSALYGVTHGAGLAALFPYWLEYSADVDPAAGYDLAVNVLDVPKDNDKKSVIYEGARRLSDFWKSLGLPSNIKELGIANPDIELLNDNLHKAKGDIVGAYIPMDRQISLSIYMMALSGEL